MAYELAGRQFASNQYTWLSRDATDMYLWLHVPSKWSQRQAHRFVADLQSWHGGQKGDDGDT